MVGSTCYRASGTEWRNPKSGSRSGGKGKHAEIQAFEKQSDKTGIFLIVQDAFPCRDVGHDCDKYFRDASSAGTASFILRITEDSGGYGPPPNISSLEPEPVEPDWQDEAQYARDIKIYNDAMADRRAFDGPRYVVGPPPGPVALPASLYYFGGAAFLIRPTTFPVHPREDAYG